MPRQTINASPANMTLNTPNNNHRSEWTCVSWFNKISDAVASKTCRFFGYAVATVVSVITFIPSLAVDLGYAAKRLYDRNINKPQTPISNQIPAGAKPLPQSVPALTSTISSTVNPEPTAAPANRTTANPITPKTHAPMSNQPVRPTESDHRNAPQIELTNPAPWTDGNQIKQLKGKVFIANLDLSPLQKNDIRNRLFTSKEWGPVFQRINEYCVDIPYAGDDRHVFNHNGQKVWRPNHNGTHSARQVRLFEVLHQLSNNRTTYKFTNEELNSLKLAAYCYRAGRVDETGGGRDQCRLRSAQVYKAHAQQMGFSDKVIQWTFEIINRNYSKPLQNPRQEHAYQLLDVGHRLDLQRCFPTMSAEIQAINNALANWGLLNESAKLLNYSANLITQTGCQLQRQNHRPFTPYQRDTFTGCSKDGQLCWNTVSNQQFPPNLKPLDFKGL